MVFQATLEIERLDLVTAGYNDENENSRRAVKHPKVSTLEEKCGKSGPARIRIAVTATRRPKDTKLPHRPAGYTWVPVRLTLPKPRKRDCVFRSHLRRNAQCPQNRSYPAVSR